MSSSINAQQKFLFDTRFDVATGVPSIDDEYPRYTALEMQKAREESFIDGQETGYRKSIESIENDISLKLGILNERLCEATSQYESVGRGIFQDVLLATLAMTRKVLPVYYETAAKEEVTKLVEECLHSLLTQSKIIVRVHESLVNYMKERIDQMKQTSGFEGQVLVLGDDHLEQIDCTIEWDQGGMHKITSVILKSMDDILTRYSLIEQPKGDV